MANLPKSPLWPEEADFLRVLCYMKVPIEEAPSVLMHINCVRPYLLQIEYESDIDFLVLLNGVTTKIVFTPRDDRANVVSHMIRELCEAEGFEDKHNVQEEEEVFYDSEESPDPAPVVEHIQERLEEAPVQEERPDAIQQDLPLKPLSKAKRRQLRRKKLQQDRDVPAPTTRLTQDLTTLRLDETRKVNSAMKNLKRLQSALVDRKLAQRALARKMAVFEECESHILKYFVHEAGELIPLQTFVSNVADLDWVRFRGTSDKINRLLERVYRPTQS